jgi:hypothetical protein
VTPTRKLAIVLMLLGAVSLVAVAVPNFHAKPRPPRLTDAVPTDAFVAIDIDVDALRSSGALGSLFQSFDPESLKMVCGVDPIQRLHELVFTVPEGANADYGVAARADLTRSATVACAQKLATARGDDPATIDTTHGSFAVFTPKNVRGDGKVEARAVAIREGGPIVLGHGDWLDRMIDAVDDARGGREPSGPHVVLREALEGELPRGTHLDVAATMLLKRSEREELQLGLASQLPRAEAIGMDSLLGVSSVTLGLYDKAEEVHALAQIACDEEKQCAGVQQIIAKLRIAWTASPMASALGPLLDHLVVERSGARIELRTVVPTESLVGWVKPFLEPTAKASRPGPVEAAEPGASASSVRVSIPSAPSASAPLRVTIPGPR